MQTTTDRLTRDAPGSQIAFLFEQYQSPIFAYLLRLVGDNDLAEDLCEKTFLAALRVRHQLPGIDHHRAWLLRLATNTAYISLNQRRRVAWFPWRVTDGSRRNIRDAEGGVVKRNAVERALLKVPLDQCAALLLYSHLGLSIAEVAEALNLNESAVKTHVYRARIRYREAYQREIRDESAR